MGLTGGPWCRALRSVVDRAPPCLQRRPAGPASVRSPQGRPPPAPVTNTRQVQKAKAAANPKKPKAAANPKKPKAAANPKKPKAAPNPKKPKANPKKPKAKASPTDRSPREDGPGGDPLRALRP